MVVVERPRAIDDLAVYGDGSDGDVTLAVGITNLNTTKFYNKLTVPSGATLRPNGQFPFVKDTLDNQSGGRIEDLGSNGRPGNNNGTACIRTAIPIGGGCDGDGREQKSGGAGQTGNGNPGGNGQGTTGRAGAAGAGGAGGTGSVGTGGAGGTLGSATVPVFSGDDNYLMDVADFLFIGGAAGGGGGGGGGDGTVRGGGGGCSGGGGGNLILLARIIINNGVIEAKGGKGGNGGSPASGNAGGGGAGAGSGGGFLYLLCDEYSGSGTTVSTGGTGGTGGTGSGTGTNGGNGVNGSSGAVERRNRIAGEAF